MLKLRRSSDFHRNAVYWGAMLVVVGMPLSTVLMSIGQFVLAGNWLLEGRHLHRIRLLGKKPWALLAMALWCMHGVWLINSTDLAYGWHDMQVKLPLLLLPLFFFTSEPLREQQRTEVLWMFVVACLAGALVGWVNVRFFDPSLAADRREFSVFTSHIRFSLMVAFSMAIAGHQLMINGRTWSLVGRALVVATLLWLFYFLVLLESFNGYLAFAAVTVAIGIWGIANLANKWLRLAWAVLVVALGIGTTIYLQRIVQQHFVEISVDWNNVPQYTAKGARYAFDPADHTRENGHRLWYFVAMAEMDSAWNSRSQFDVNGTDKKGQAMRGTLMRYLTSKGLYKDSVGVWTLSSTDLKAIENGVTNHRFNKTWGVERRFDEALWEVEHYLHTGHAGNSSLMQRVVHAKVGWAIFRQNLLFGVGTGDVKAQFRAYYQSHTTGLEERFWARTHNQFLTFLLTFGVFGGSLAALMLVLPGLVHWRQVLFLAFWAIAMASMFGDDTLETQSGATFYAFFSAFLLSGTSQKKENPPQTHLGG